MNIAIAIFVVFAVVCFGWAALSYKHGRSQDEKLGAVIPAFVGAVFGLIALVLALVWTLFG